MCSCLIKETIQHFSFLALAEKKKKQGLFRDLVVVCCLSSVWLWQQVCVLSFVYTFECWETHESPSFFLFTLPRLTFNLLQNNKSVWQVAALNGLRLSELLYLSCILIFLSCVLINSVYFIFFFFILYFPSSLLFSHLFIPGSSSSPFLYAESLCFSTRSSRAPSALGRQRWWRGESSPPMSSSSSGPHCWLHTCSHLESGETHTHKHTQTHFFPLLYET